MKKESKYHISTVPTAQDVSDTLYAERETQSTHLSFQAELSLCTAIQNGDSELLDELIDKTLSKEIVAGQLSGNPLTQMKYWCVTVIANAIHYAILGGLDETDAYNLSDQYIRNIDSFTDSDVCIDYLCKKARELVSAVSQANTHSQNSPKIKKVLHYIHIHLHEKITIDRLASHVNLSRDYLSVLFLKETGMTIHSFIMQEKLKEAQKLLASGRTCREVSYTLAFSSQSHFTEVYKKAYGFTPSDYQKGSACLCPGNLLLSDLRK